jgi:hypothetical protein
MSYRSPKTVVRESPIQERGLFAAAPIGAGETVAVKGGHVFNRETLERIQPALGPAESRSEKTSLSAPSTRPRGKAR